MKKLMVSGGMLAVGAMVLSGCASSSGSSDDTLELWTAWTEGAATQQAIEPLIDEWEEETGYTVNLTNFSFDQLRQKLVASAAGGNLPDVVWGLPEYMAEFSRLGILADLTDEWDSWDGAANVSDSVKDAVTVDGQIVGIPYSATVRAYLVHDDIFAQAGLDDVPETWDDVLGLGTSVKDATGADAYGLTGTGARAPQELLVYLAQEGVQIAEEQDGGGYRNTWADDPEAMEGATAVFQFYKDLVDSGAVSPNSPTYGWEETDENFATGLTASFVSGNWLAEREDSNPDTMMDVSVHQIPIPEGGQPATYLEVKPVFVMNTTSNMDGAFALAEAFASEEWQEAGFPDRSSLSTVSTDSKWSSDFNALVDAGVTYPPVALGGITQNMIDAIAMVLQAGDSPQEAAAWLGEAINESLEESGELAAQ